MKTLILGGIRSGKSRLAEKLARQSNLAVTYIATANVTDEEMQQRVSAHRLRRPAGWQVYEEPLSLGLAVHSHAAADVCLLVDCLSLWMTNLLLEQDQDKLDREVDALLLAVQQCPGELIMVSNEANMGIIPLGELSRRYCDQMGLLHQNVAEQCDRVIFTVAGLPHYLKGA